jgi:predicted RNA-binding protein associated with RNAse of E/G family
MDLALDLVVEPDGAWRWKDEDEYAQCRRLGVVTDAEHAAVTRAREQAVALVESRAGVFGEVPARPWLPDPAWPRPTLTNL